MLPERVKRPRPRRVRSAAPPLRWHDPALLFVVCAVLFAASALVALTALGHTECKLAQELFDKGNVDDVLQVDCDGGPQLHAKVTGTDYDKLGVFIVRCVCMSVLTLNEL